MASLSGYISGHDFAPADAHRAVHEMYKENLGTYMQQMTEIREGDLAHWLGPAGGCSCSTPTSASPTSTSSLA